MAGAAPQAPRTSSPVIRGSHSLVVRGRVPRGIKGHLSTGRTSLVHNIERVERGAKSHVSPPRDHEERANQPPRLPHLGDFFEKRQLIFFRIPLLGPMGMVRGDGVCPSSRGSLLRASRNVAVYSLLPQGSTRYRPFSPALSA
jgi:hypothetical protein